MHIVFSENFIKMEIGFSLRVKKWQYRANLLLQISMTCDCSIILAIYNWVSYKSQRPQFSLQYKAEGMHILL